jgi:hypothetical protein
MKFANKIGHETFGPKLVKQTEIKMMKYLEWNLDMVTSFHFIKHIILLMKKSLSISESFKEILKTLELAALQFAKMIVIDDKLTSYRASELAIGAFAVACDYIYDLAEENEKKMHDGLLGIQHSFDKDKVETIFGFFQDLVKQKELFDSERISEVESKVKEVIESFEKEYYYCPNVIKFTLIKPIE